MNNIKGQIIGGEFGKLTIRQKNSQPIEIGELLIAESQDEVMLVQVYNISYGSQISQQNLELVSGMFLEEEQPVKLYDEHLRNYTIAHVKTLLKIKNTNASIAKNLPKQFSTVREVTEKDLTFLQQTQDQLQFGNLRSGSKELPVQIGLDIQKVLSHHILIPSTTGKGKSNLMSTLLWDGIQKQTASFVVFDPHDEYFGRTTHGLKDHPNWNSNGIYYTTTNPPPGARTLSINLTLLHPKQFFGVTNFTQPQEELLTLYYKEYKQNWIEAIVLQKELSFDFQESTRQVVIRRLCRLLDIQIHQNTLHCNGIYQQNVGLSTLTDINQFIEQAKTIIIDTSSLLGQSELLLSSLITNAIFDSYRYSRQQGTLHTKPIVSIVLEEALRVLGKDVLEQGSNIFATIAKEGRKFHVGLCAITQLPSLIPKEILANMNTKIILGIEMASERNAVIESAAQDLSDDAKQIASLDKGEAILTSNFGRFAMPIKIPLFYTVIQKSKNTQTQKIKLQGM